MDFGLELPTGYCYANCKNEGENQLTIRCNINNSDEWRCWLNKYESLSRQKFILLRTLKAVKLAFHQKLVCQHSKRNKVRKELSQPSSRNTACKASVSCKIKHITKNTCKTDHFLLQDPPLPAVLTFNLEHNHQIHCADAMRKLRVSDETRQVFNNYFNDGLSPASAIALHEDKIMCEENGFEKLANASINPTSRTVYHLYNIWRKENFGTMADPLQKLMDKVEYYSGLGIQINISTEKPWCVVIVSGLMVRAQSLPTAHEIVFIDSSCNCDTTQSTVTTILVASKAGAVPIAILLHEGQSLVSYKSAFELLSLHHPECFNGHKSPDAVMTDDSSALKSAIKVVWPSTRQFLCHFHVGQAEWRWLTAKANNIPLDERQKFMRNFRMIMYANSDSELDAAKAAFCNEMDSINEMFSSIYKKRIEKFLDRGNEWLLVRRQGVLIRGNNTNNFSEVTMRILKDIILMRTKAFNVVALVDFLSSVFEAYLVKRLLAFANSRRAQPVLDYNSLCSKMKDLDPASVNIVDDNNYTIPSQSRAGVYFINAEFGLCSCLSGYTGAFCKHQAYIHHHFSIPLPNVPAIGTTERYQLALLALGSKCPSKEFFAGMLEPAEKVLGLHKVTEMLHDDGFGMSKHNAENVPSEEEPNWIMSLTEEFGRITNLIGSSGNKAIGAILPLVKSLKTEEQFCRALYHCRSALLARKGGKIKVQPTAVSRRRPGITRGCQRVASGRPVAVKSTRRPSKRPRLLAENIEANVPHAKSHGSGH